MWKPATYSRRKTCLLISWSSKSGPKHCPEMSVKQPTNSEQKLEEPKSQTHLVESQKSHMNNKGLVVCVIKQSPSSALPKHFRSRAPFGFEKQARNLTALLT